MKNLKICRVPEIHTITNRILKMFANEYAIPLKDLLTKIKRISHPWKLVELILLFGKGHNDEKSNYYQPINLNSARVCLKYSFLNN